MNDVRYLGIDVGSTTAKVVMFDDLLNIVYSDYRRHHADIQKTVIEIFEDIKKEMGDVELTVSITGSAGMGLAEKMEVAFVQEVVASAEIVKVKFPQIRTLIDIGGEDTKMIFFQDGLTPDIRMNGSCAGGTGAFIDQIATLIDRPISELNELAEKSTNIYPIASRCGVFAKTDVQSLLSREISHNDIAASLFHAIAIQTINALARGYDVEPMILFSGGPLAFIPQLRETFKKVLNITDKDIFLPEKPELLPAMGAALNAKGLENSSNVEYLINKLNTSFSNHTLTEREKPLFEKTEEFKTWIDKRQTKVERIPLGDFKNDAVGFLGIDSGSTTTKIVLTDKNGKLVIDYYASNHGDHIGSVKKGLEFIDSELKKHGINDFKLLRAAVTGYGEDLIKTSFNLDDGVVETLAHFTAAKAFDKEVSFILDIGGQDMKAMFIQDGAIKSIELNEACSSGCGSFIETFAGTLGYNTVDFAQIACEAQAPADLGSRCTVFMNSKVKQFLKEGVSVGDISAGLAYSVVKNSLYKVLKLRDVSILGEHIVVQGGTFQNPAVHRAFEELLGKSVLSPDIPGLMGAYGSALMAKEFYEIKKEKEEYSSFIGFDKLDFSQSYEKKFLTCHGCENVCTITKLKFDKDNTFFTGNKCEKYFSNKGNYIEPGISLADYKYDLLFKRNDKNDKNKKKITFGIPRALNMYENYPFWHTLITNLGFDVVLSAKSSMKLYEKGLGTIMADNICFPAKVTHGHILNLVDKKVDRIFYPMVMYEKPEFKKAINTFNCPIVTGYPEVITSAVNPEKKYGIPVDKPTISFKEKKLLKKGSYEYFKQFGIKKREFDKAFELAVNEHNTYKYKIKAKSKEIVKKAREAGEPIIMLVGRPYHIDPLLNHKISQILVDLGLYVITEDSIEIDDESLASVDVLTQWSYPNRIYHAAEWAAKYEDVEVVQLNSFGCGPDAIVTDEIREILKTADKNLTLIKIDEISSTGAVKLRLRTLAESLRLKIKKGLKHKPRVTTRLFEEYDKDKLILIPEISRFYTTNTAKVFEALGYKAEILPTPNKESSDYGMRFANNEICYPSILVVGDIIKALDSGKYDLDKVAVGITQTGGQCRASSYLSLIKKGMVAAGYSHIPIVGIATNGTSHNNQPGFEDFDTGKFLKKALIGIMYGDAIAKMYYTTAVREINKGESDKLVEKHIKRFAPVSFTDNIDTLIELLEDAITDFNNVEVDDKKYPVIGIVGEIFIKYNDYGNRNLVHWLMQQEVEVRVPPLLDFFTQELLNIRFDRKNNVGKIDSSYFISFLFEHKVNKMINRIDYSMKRFRYYYKDHTIKELAEMGGKIVSLVNQYGEGWLIPAEVSGFMKDGINNIVSLQPFGCIANHVIAKGVEKKLKETYPKLNMLFLDLDADTSEVNYLNRLYFLIKAAKDGDVMPSDIASVDTPVLKAEINI